MVIVEARSGPNQGFARPPFTGLRVVAMSKVGSDDSDEAIEPRTCRINASAPAERERAGGGRKAAEKRAAGYRSLVLQ
jgi:hypothetical protein